MQDIMINEILASDPTKPVLIAGPTASGKSDLALEIATRSGGVIVNADALQVYENWRILSARPSKNDEDKAPHSLYGHISWDQDYSVGEWLRDVRILLNGDNRLIIVGGTGLYFTALTQGLADIPPTSQEIRETANQLLAQNGIQHLLNALDDETRAAIDVQNPMRVQRAWEVLTQTNRSIVDWQRTTPAPILRLDQTLPILFDVEKDILNGRIETRFQKMIELGALEEVRENYDRWDPTLLSSKAIGAPELIAYLAGETTLDDACTRATIATRQFAKRQRTWFRSKMGLWRRYSPHAK
jgi:tRNA dimethylallyltransferase